MEATISVDRVCSQYHSLSYLVSVSRDSVPFQEPPDQALVEIRGESFLSKRFFNILPIPAPKSHSFYKVVGKLVDRTVYPTGPLKKV